MLLICLSKEGMFEPSNLDMKSAYRLFHVQREALPPVSSAPDAEEDEEKVCYLVDYK